MSAILALATTHALG